MYSGTRAVAEQLELEGPVACVDGSHIVEARSHRELCVHLIETAAAGALVGILDEFETVGFVFSGDVIHHDRRGADYLPYVSLWSERVLEHERVLDREHWSGEGADRVSAVVSLGSREQIQGARTAIELQLSARVQVATFEIRRTEFGGGWGLVARAAGVNKGTAIEWLAAHYGIPPAEVVAVGDWFNDVPMLRAAGRSFAMGQAPDAVKRAATDVLETDAWKGGGIAEAAERAGLL
jgi:hydroxymethylpyrimidine pyrophosphatase-like HAD family hydrolase